MTDAASSTALAPLTVRRVEHRRRWSLRQLPIRALVPLADLAAFVLTAFALGLPDVLTAIYGVVGFLAVRPTRQQRIRLDRRPSEGMRDVSGRVALATCLTAALPLAGGSRSQVLVAGVVAFVALIVARAGVRALVHAVRRRGVWMDPTVIVGAGPVAVALARVLQRRREFGVEPIGFVERGEVADDTDLPVLGSPQELPRILADHDVRRIVVAFGAAREHELLTVLRTCTEIRSDLKVHVLPRFYELGVHVDAESDDVWGFPLVPVRQPGPGRAARWLKRGFDVAAALVLGVLLSPVLLATALAVRLSSPGPILFRQERVGQHGHTFDLVKFRSMRPTDGEAGWVPDEDRITAVGRLMRPTHLDELPQLWNVLKGDMALVGPRPERPRYVEEFTDEHRGYAERHRVPVGLTGWAQVNGLWGDTSIADRARFDNRYIEDWSAWRDLTILARTIPSVLGQKATGQAPSEAPSEAATPSRAPAPPRPERILHVVQPTDGGAARYVADLARHQADQGRRQVTVAAPDGGRLATWLAGSTVDHRTWQAQRSPTAGVGTEVRGLTRLLDDLDPQLVHLHAAKAGLAGRLALRGDRPTVFQPHCWSFDVADGATATVALAWERLSSRWSHGTVCVSEAERRSAEDRGVRGTLHVVANGVDLDVHPYQDTEARTEARRTLGLPDAPTALFLGRLSRDKGPDRLLDAWPDVLGTEPEARLVVVGDGPLRDELEARGVPGVTFAGWADDPRPWYAAADVVVLPSRWEALPLVALEAMASGRSVVATDVGGLRDTIGDDAGAVVPGDPLDELGNAVARRLRDPERALLEGKAGRHRVECDHDLAGVFDRIDEVYASASRRWRRVHAA